MKERPVSPMREAPLNGVVFDAKKQKDLRHNKNLHGEGTYLQGLTGFYHTRYYRYGRHQPNNRHK